MKTMIRMNDKYKRTAVAYISIDKQARGRMKGIENLMASLLRRFAYVTLVTNIKSK